jgi:hypothetical protein
VEIVQDSRAKSILALAELDTGSDCSLVNRTFAEAKLGKSQIILEEGEGEYQDGSIARLIGHVNVRLFVQGRETNTSPRL